MGAMSQNGAHTAEEHWIVRRFSPRDPEELLLHIEMLRRTKKTGKMTLNFYRGGVGTVEFQEKLPGSPLSKKS